MPDGPVTTPDGWSFRRRRVRGTRGWRITLPSGQVMSVFESDHGKDQVLFRLMEALHGEELGRSTRPVTWSLNSDHEALLRSALGALLFHRVISQSEWQELESRLNSKGEQPGAFAAHRV